MFAICCTQPARSHSIGWIERASFVRMRTFGVSTATHLAATWSLSDDPLRRLAVAHALEWTFPLVGDALVIDHLSRDADPQVRAASARAAWARRPGGDPGVLARLSLDPDPAVREVATSGRPA